MNRAALWLRVSSSEQSTENQRADLLRVAERRGWEVVRAYDVTGSAWKGDHDAALDEVVADAGRGEFDWLLIWSLDRLTRRGGPETLQSLGRFTQRRVRVYSYRESWLEDISDPHVAQLFTYLAGWLAERESLQRSERTKAGQARARAEGRRPGRRRVRLSADRARKLVDEHGSAHAAARATGLARATILRRLKEAGVSGSQTSPDVLS